jgi:AbrB family looped-hinge helix DNA binding protein
MQAGGGRVGCEVEAVKLTNEGQITLPSNVREDLGLCSGDEIEFVAEPAGYRIQKKIREPQPFRGYVGYLRGLAGQDPDDLVRELRGV